LPPAQDASTSAGSVRVAALRKEHEERSTPCVADACEIKSPGADAKATYCLPGSFFRFFFALLAAAFSFQCLRAFLSMI
jgi:hypothetical protein